MQEKELKEKVINMLVTRLQLPETDWEEYDLDAPLFYQEDGSSIFELDSVDSLEIVVGLKQEFGIIVGEEDTKQLYSINTIIRYVEDKMAAKEEGDAHDKSER